MEKTERECCWWREKLELAIQKEDESIIQEVMWNWVRYGEIDQTGSQFICLLCQKRVIEIGKIVGVDFADKDIMREAAQAKIRAGVIKCCEIVPMIDLNDPEKLILYEWALSFKIQFHERLCFACSVKVNGVLATVGESSK